MECDGVPHLGRALAYDLVRVPPSTLFNGVLSLFLWLFVVFILAACFWASLRTGLVMLLAVAIGFTVSYGTRALLTFVVFKTPFWWKVKCPR